MKQLLNIASAQSEKPCNYSTYVVMPAMGGGVVGDDKNEVLTKTWILKILVAEVRDITEAIYYLQLPDGCSYIKE